MPMILMSSPGPADVPLKRRRATTPSICETRPVNRVATIPATPYLYYEGQSIANCDRQGAGVSYRCAEAHRTARLCVIWLRLRRWSALALWTALTWPCGRPDLMVVIAVQVCLLCGAVLWCWLAAVRAWWRAQDGCLALAVFGGG
jgi:hypothetical protein